MTHDPELIKTLARTIAACSGHNPDKPSISGDAIWTLYSRHAAAVLAEIDASGTHWVAPWEYTPEMERALSDIEEHWGELRDVYLAERRGTP